MKRTKRTDPHRPGAIVPADYEAVFCFNMSSTIDGWPVPSYRVNCELDGRTELRDDKGKLVRIINGEHSPDGNCCVIGLRKIRGDKFALDGGPGACTVCGAFYIHGEAWRHKPTGEIIFLGHDCAEKYGLLTDHSETELAALRARAGVLMGIQRQKNDAARAAFLAAHPELGALLARAPEHALLADLADKLTKYLVLSDKQIQLAQKIVHELDNPKAAEITVPAPIGKQTFRGTVVSAKVHEGAYGSTVKITVKVTTPEGVWLAWGTEPAAIRLQSEAHGYRLKGAEVELTATLKAGRDPHFAIMGRPRGKALAFHCEHPAACEGCQRAAMGDEAYELKRFVERQRWQEHDSRRAGLFDEAVYAQWFADEAERTGRLPAEDLSGRTPNYIWYRATGPALYA